MLGGRPTLADFAMMGPLYAHLFRDPVPGKLVRTRAPLVGSWIERVMGHPTAVLFEPHPLHGTLHPAAHGEGRGGGALASDVPATKSSAGDEVEQALGFKAVKSTKVDERGREYTSYEVVGDDDLSEVLKNQDMSVLDSLSSEQITAIGALENGDSKTPEEVNNALSKVPGLTDEQIQSLVDLEMSLLQSSETLNSDGNKKE
jgi:hypothetical protein